MKKPKWTNAELLTLGDLYRDGKSYNEIAVKMKRTRAGIAYALNQYRDVINVEYKKEGSGRKPVQPEPEKKPWWKFW
jgi:transposase